MFSLLVHSSLSTDGVPALFLTRTHQFHFLTFSIFFLKQVRGGGRPRTGSHSLLAMTGCALAMLSACTLAAAAGAVAACSLVVRPSAPAQVPLGERCGASAAGPDGVAAAAAASAAAAGGAVVVWCGRRVLSPAGGTRTRRLGPSATPRGAAPTRGCGSWMAELLLYWPSVPSVIGAMQPLTISS